MTRFSARFATTAARPRLMSSACAILIFASHLALTHAQNTATPNNAGARPATGAQSQPAQDAQTPAPATQNRTEGDARSARGSRAASERGASALSGRVVDESGQPLANVSVYIRPRAADGTARPPIMALTDEDGSFQATGLDPGAYNVNTAIPGYVMDAQPQAGRAFASVYRPGEFVQLRMIKGGVITGTVTSSSGDPLVEARVRAFFLRSLEAVGPRDTGFSYSREITTDDWGVYRLYGLQPGIYIVAAGGNSQWAYSTPTPYDLDVPTFYPSSTRDGASEVAVRAGQETSAIDIRHRGESGHVISGQIVYGEAQQGSNANGTNIMLTHVTTGTVMTGLVLTGEEGDRAFSFAGVADGDYDIQAQRIGRESTSVSSPPQRISVRGADVTGIRLKLAPLSSISGTLILARMSDAERAASACREQQAALLPQEVIVSARRDEQEPPSNQPRSRVSRYSDATPDETGDFTLRYIEEGRYRLDARPLLESWYLRALQLPDAASAITAANSTSTTAAGRAASSRRTGARPATPRNDASAAQSPRDWLDMKPGQQVRNVKVTLAEGAASVRGRVTAGEEGASPPAAQLMRVYLVPAEREQADNVLRYAETFVASDGAFALPGLAPGSYRLLLRTLKPNEAEENRRRPLRWDAEGRARLRREAEAAGTTLELQPCQRVEDYALRAK